MAASVGASRNEYGVSEDVVGLWGTGRPARVPRSPGNWGRAGLQPAGPPAGILKTSQWGKKLGSPEAEGLLEPSLGIHNLTHPVLMLTCCPSAFAPCKQPHRGSPSCPGGSLSSKGTPLLHPTLRSPCVPSDVPQQVGVMVSALPGHVRERSSFQLPNRLQSRGALSPRPDPGVIGFPSPLRSLGLSAQESSHPVILARGSWKPQAPLPALAPESCMPQAPS